MASTVDSKPLPSGAPASPSLPWKTRIAVFFLSALTDSARRSNDTVNRRLLHFLDIRADPSPKPVKGVKSSDVFVDPARKLWFRVFTPTAVDSAASLPVIVYFHGGGFTFMSPASKAYDFLCRRFARKLPAVVISVNYRLTPEHRFPSQYDDGFDVLKYIDDHFSSELPQNADIGRCFLAGDSAGGNLAHHLAVKACKTKFERVRIVGLIALQPFFGGEERTESEIHVPGFLVSVPRTDWHWKVFLPEGEDRDHWAVNVSGPNAVDISGLDGFPSTIVFMAGFDPLRDWQRRYYEWLKGSGKEAELVDYPNTVHAFYVFPELPENIQLFAAVKDFVARKIAI